MAVPEDRSNQRIGKYQLASRLGRGGMGEVYEAVDLHLRRRVAIKLLPADATELPRLLREARAAARVSHPNVVITHDVGRDGNVFYIVMELIRGRTAQALVALRGPLPWTEATKLLAAACRGLFAAHEAGLIHRDVKPANLLCPDEGEPKLADFGLAKPALTGNQLTHANTVLGTPEYMSPEQCRGEQLDPRTDIYSLGATYYYLLTGQLPYTAPDRAGVMFAHCTEPPPDPRAAVPDVPDGCAAVVLRAMAKKRADRYPDCRAMTAELVALLNGTGIELPSLTQGVVSPPPADDPEALVDTLAVPRVGRRRYLPWLAGLGALVIAVVAGAAIFSPRSTARGPQPDVPQPANTPAQKSALASGGSGKAAQPEVPASDLLIREWRLLPQPGRQLWSAPEPFWFATGGGGSETSVSFWGADRSRRSVEVGARVVAVAADPRVSWCAVANAGGQVVVLSGPEWAVASRIELGAPVTALAARDARLAVATATGLRLYDVTVPADPKLLELPNASISGLSVLAFSADGTYLAGLTSAPATEVWDLAAMRYKARAVAGGVTPTGLAFGREPGQLLTVGQKSGRSVFYLWDQVGRGPPREVSGPATATALAVFRDHKMAVLAGGGWLGLYDAFGTGGARPLSNRLAVAGLRTVIVSPTGRQFLCGYEDGSVEQWGYRTGTP